MHAPPVGSARHRDLPRVRRLRVPLPRRAGQQPSGGDDRQRHRPEGEGDRNPHAVHPPVQGVPQVGAGSPGSGDPAGLISI